MSKCCERLSERMSEWPSTLRVDFIVIVLNVRCKLFHFSSLWLPFLTAKSFSFRRFMIPNPLISFPRVAETQENLKRKKTDGKRHYDENAMERRAKNTAAMIEVKCEVLCAT